MGEINLFYFYTALEGGAMPAELVELLNLSIASAKKVCAVNRVIFGCHATTRAPEAADIDVFLPSTSKIPAQDIMHLRAASFLEYAKSPHFDRPTLCTEHDMLVQKDFAPVFEKPFDVACTYACWTKKMGETYGKVNGGAFFMNDADKPKTQAILARYLKFLHDLGDQRDPRFKRNGVPVRARQWGGDELALLSLLPSEAFHGDKLTDKIFDIKIGRIGILNSKEWNNQYGYPGLTGEIVTPHQPEAYLRHFHGPKKTKLKAYAAKHLGLGA